jgi:condensin-2 complex subunit H2
LWQSKLLPLLDEEDSRPVFDIHLYGDNVIRKIESQIDKIDDGITNTMKPAKVVAFRDITRDCEPYDVCRMFLASLSLTNSGNIEFVAGSSLNALHVELVKSDVVRPARPYNATTVDTN